MSRYGPNEWIEEYIPEFDRLATRAQQQHDLRPVVLDRQSLEERREQQMLAENIEELRQAEEARLPPSHATAEQFEYLHEMADMVIHSGTGHYNIITALTRACVEFDKNFVNTMHMVDGDIKVNFAKWASAVDVDNLTRVLLDPALTTNNALNRHYNYINPSQVELKQQQASEQIEFQTDKTRLTHIHSTILMPLYFLEHQEQVE